MNRRLPDVWNARIRRLVPGSAALVVVGVAYVLMPNVPSWIAAVFIAGGVLFGWRVLAGYIHAPGCAALRTRGRECDCPVRGRA